MADSVQDILSSVYKCITPLVPASDLYPLILETVMAPKRKAPDTEVIDLTTSNAGSSVPTKKQRVSKSSARASTSDDGKETASTSVSKKTWKDIKLVQEKDGSVPVYDNCNEIRRKIVQLRQTPGFKITHWLAEIGNINNNSFNRFMKAKGPTGGAGNGTYYAAYVYFEKVRILEGKKKGKKRLSNEREHPYGFELRDRTHEWVLVRA